MITNLADLKYMRKAKREKYPALLCVNSTNANVMKPTEKKKNVKV